MNLKVLRQLTGLMLVIGASAWAHGPGMREPMADERPVIDHYAEVMRGVMAQCDDDAWRDDPALAFDVKDDVLVSGSPEGPFDVNEQVSHTYVNASSAKKLNRVTVQARINVLNLPVTPHPGHGRELHVPGAAFAFHVKNYKYDSGTSVVLLFGNWKAARWNVSEGAYHYHFIHKTHAPVIENIVVQLDGSEDRVEQLLKTVDWKKVNEGLTRQWALVQAK